jgi:hypothetical protein
MQSGIAAVTCGGAQRTSTNTLIPPNMSYTFGLIDPRAPLAVDYAGHGTSAPLWNAPMYHDPSWTVENLGNLYGIALDADGDIFVCAHGLYGSYQPIYHRYGNLGGGATSLSAAGTVYRIDRITGAATVFAVIPGQQTTALGNGLNSGPGLGNIAWDPVNDQFFVTSMEDGKIYRVNNAGTVVQTYDPLTADNGAAGPPALSDRIWAIGVSAGAVHYSVWNAGTVSNPSKIRRLNILTGGAMDPSSDVEILTIPGHGSSFFSSPVSDLEFSADGRTMLLGDRTMGGSPAGGGFSYNHYSRNHIATLTGSTWSVVRTLTTGCNQPEGESYGGVAFGQEAGAPEAIIWMTSADMAMNYGPHGVFGVRTTDFPVTGMAANSWKIPFDPIFTNSFYDDRKGSGGDVDIMQSSSCMELSVADVHCPDDIAAPYTVTLNVKNLQPGVTAVYGWLTPCPSASLPPGAVTAQPSPVGVFPLATPIPYLGTGNVVATLTLTLGGKKVCFRLTLLDSLGKECCTEKICIDLPRCDCAEIVSKTVTCEPQSDGTIKYTITLTVKNQTNLSPTPYPFSYANFLPPAGFAPATVTLSPPIAPGATGTITTCYFGAPGLLCFTLALHDGTIEHCCSIEKVCIDLPPCGVTKPDTCAVETAVNCVRPPGVPFGTATLNFTVCNNSAVPRTYTWTAAGNSTPGCTGVLTAADFSPAGGSLGPIPPGGCASVTIVVDCRNLGPGECAGFLLCASASAAVPPLCCPGIVRRPTPGAATITATGGLVSIAPGAAGLLPVTVWNTSTSARSISITPIAETGNLVFGTPGGPTPPVTDVIPEPVPFDVVVPAGGSVPIEIPMRRVDNGAGMPPFADVNFYLFGAGPELTLPVALLAPIPGPLAIVDIGIDPAPFPQVVLDVSTTAGIAYQLQESLDMSPGSWIGATCSGFEVPTTSAGHFLSPGGILRFSLPCELTKPRRFFRFVEVP